ncbi:TetR/AcrR family transcriptional regulator [Edwardsiella ictaluri]|uniref:Transcriptional regulator, TetR family n=2 Tax=Edwardsiella ictaluri TaxID=67780 RepID=C5BC65_EDWI9|nr:TetR/AcrR family transcriptional regulator [Edwardsiella ictaluri]ACR70971.1 transcriptional regulator, TetR family [Edwardsiella ictaluri 93-146]ARD39805.1 TetR family transcriptional regulator [Edwardsiella ictaluri]AVZ82271.1 TetR/AcrR family transcriptional regulator [Edwardsiella ictaluri]EKS7764306.1 TetR/AcrR family transcriptional regulator [Edwardsiella ictaluri]EKS7771203.1 TetR/AcrR family transcriptional regulator [Edwardsiella ictaluri]
MARPLQHDRDVALQQAVALFWRRGYFATSMKEIEQALNMRPGSIYAAFGNKAALFSSALTRYTQSQVDAFFALMADYPDPFSGAEAFLRHFGATCSTELPSSVCFLVKSLLELEGRAEDAPLSVVRESLAAMEAAFYRAFREGVSPLVEAEARQMARWLQKEVIGIRIMALQIGNSPALAALVDDSCVTLRRWRASVLS